MPPSASAAGNVLSLPTVTGAVALTLQASEGEGAEAGWTASAWAKGLLATSSHLALSAAGAAASVEDGDDDSVSGSKSAALSSNPLRLDGGGRGAGARQESGAAWYVPPSKYILLYFHNDDSYSIEKCTFIINLMDVLFISYLMFL